MPRNLLPIATRLIALLAAGYIRLVRATTRWQVEGQSNLDVLLEAEDAFIVSIWHGRLFLSPSLAIPGWQNVAMISRSRDGELIAAIVARFGVTAVRGSTRDNAKGRDKGGAQAFAAALERLSARRTAIVITPDGPRGPRMRAQPGVAAVAEIGGHAILPVAFSVAWGVLGRNWDRFLVPLPFGRGAIVYGTPIQAEGLTREALTAEVEAATTDATDRADMLCGRQPILAEDRRP